ncbi:MAG: FtsX-like permease family protein [Treponema sp.]|nr:FtsX-like permease family protein [Treponema sp.]
MTHFILGLRSLLLRKRQYLSLFLVCAIGVGISLFSVFVINGMLDSLRMKAKIYYGGDLQFIGGNNELYFPDAEGMIEKLKDVFPKQAVISQRFDFDAQYAALYFEGLGVRQRVIKGVDFKREKNLFEYFTFVSGSAQNMADTNGILLSKPIAEMLECNTGDTVILMLRDRHDYINTVELEVKGIFSDSSLFGMYTSYMDVNVLKDAFGMERKACNRIVISFSEHDKEALNIDYYQSMLEQKFNMFEQVDDKNIFYRKLIDERVLLPPTYALIPLKSNLKEVEILIDAMNVISSFIIYTLVLIIIIGISSTYRVLVMKRSNEIGIYMAIGMNRNGIRKILLSENFVLLVTGCFAGFLLSLLLCYFTKFVNFSFIPAFDIFLSKGVIIPVIDIFSIFAICLIVIVTTTIAVLFAVQKTVKMTPCQALAVTG